MQHAMYIKSGLNNAQPNSDFSQILKESLQTSQKIIKRSIYFFIGLIIIFIALCFYKSVDDINKINSKILDNIENDIQAKIEIYNITLRRLNKELEGLDNLTEEEVYKKIKTYSNFLKKYNSRRSAMEVRWKGENLQNFQVNQGGIKKTPNTAVEDNIKGDDVYEISIQTKGKNGAVLGVLSILEDLTTLFQTSNNAQNVINEDLIVSDKNITNEYTLVQNKKNINIGDKSVYIILKNIKVFYKIINDIYLKIAFSLISLVCYIYLIKYLNKKTSKNFIDAKAIYQALYAKERYIAKFYINIEKHNQSVFCKKNISMQDVEYFDYNIFKGTINYFSEDIIKNNLDVKYSICKDIKQVAFNMLVLQRCLLSLLAESLYNLKKNGKIEIRLSLNDKKEIVLHYKDNSYAMDIEEEVMMNCEKLEFYISTQKLLTLLSEYGGNVKESVVVYQGKEVEISLPSNITITKQSNVINLFSRKNDF